MIKSAYSFKMAAGSLQEVMSRLKEIGWQCAPIADYLSCFSFMRWKELCAKEQMRPIYGVCLPVSANPLAGKPTVDHWTFLAKNDVRALNELVALATRHANPALSYMQALSATGVIKIAGSQCLLDHMQPMPDLYIGLSPALPKQLFLNAREAGYRFVATSCNLYPRQDDLEFYRVALGSRANTQTYPQFIMSDEEWAQSIEWFADDIERHKSIINRDFIFDICHADLQQFRLLHPNQTISLRTMCAAGAECLGLNLDDPIYQARLDRELQVIEDKKFEDYFYIVSDMMQFAKTKMLCGPGRGSSAGSLVCYLLGITTVDPIVHGTMFERFLDITRTDWPDIDTDVSDERRDLVFDYMSEKYGAEHVARLGAVGTCQIRNALKTCGSLFDVPPWEYDKLIQAAPQRAAGDDRPVLNEAFETEIGKKILGKSPAMRIASRLENCPTHGTRHAAGLLLTAEPIIKSAAVDARNNTAMIDLEDVEKLGMVKIDVLGLVQLSIFERALAHIGIENGNEFLRRLPLDDPATFAVMNDGHLSGVFQFQGGALQGLTRQMTVETFDDLVMLTSLARPGPLEAGVTQAWITYRTTGRKPPGIHPRLAELCPAGIIFQEDFMKVAREIGGMSWEQVTKLRKLVAKSKGADAIEQYWRPFADGAMSNGLEESEARTIWEQLLTFGRYGFCKAHAVSYSLQSYYCMWFKAHYPVEFAAATLDAELDPLRQIQLLRELNAGGVDYVAFDAQLSAGRWTLAERDGRKVLIGPLTNIKGVGPAAMKEILDCRAQGKAIRASLANKIQSVKTAIDSLFPIADAIERVCPDLQQANIFSEPTPIDQIQCGNMDEILVIGIATKINEKDMNGPAEIQRRGYALRGDAMTLNIYIRDDSGEILAKIDRFEFDRLAHAVMKIGGAGKAIYAIKGSIPTGFRMISVKQIRFLGYMNEDGNGGSHEQSAQGNTGNAT